MELHKITSLLESIKSFLVARRKELKTPEDRPLHPRIVNQERDGCVLFTWNDFSSLTKTETAVTHVGIYDHVSRSHKVIWIYNQKIKIVSCSINQERSLLALTLVTKNSSSQEPHQGQDKYSAFLAELQATGERVFSLNLERPNFLKVQFLYPSGKEVNTTREAHMLVFLHKESIGLYHIPLARMGDKGVIMNDQPRTEQIVNKFVWCQWDGLTQTLHYVHNTRHSANPDKIYPKYSCLQFYQNARFDNMVSGPLENVHMAGAFENVHVAGAFENVHVGGALENVHVGGAFENVHVGGAFEKSSCKNVHVGGILENFNVCGAFENVQLDVPLNFPFPYIRSASRCRYTESPLCPGIPDADLNIQVLSQSNGSVCICYQHLIRSRKSQKSEEKHNDIDINYYILMVHHAKTIHGCINGIDKSTVHNRRLLFQWSGDYLMVMLPGTFLHLLNVSIEYEPCHHILLHNKPNSTVTKIRRSSSTRSSSSLYEDKSTTEDEAMPSASSMSPDETSTSQDESPTVPKSTSQPAVFPVTNLMGPNIRSLIPCFGFLRETSGNGLVFDQKNCVVWQAVIKPEILLQYFYTTSYTNKLSIVHYILTRVKDLFIIKKLFENICEDVTNTKLKLFLAEYLVASTYISMKRQLEKDILRLLPFTSVEPYKGQLERNQSEERMATVTYSSVDSINITSKTARERHFRQSEDLWDSLRRMLQLKQIEPEPRYKLDAISKFLDKQLKEKVKEDHSSSFLDEEKDFPSISKQSSGLSTRSSSSAESTFGSVPDFLNRISRETPGINKQVENCLTDHLEQYLKKEWRIKAKNIAQEFVACQAVQTKQLCHFLWNVCGQENSSDETQPKLYECGSVEDYNMFLLLERYYLTLTEISFPFPPGFHTYFTSMAFRCLNITLFLQYVERGVLKLTGGFMIQLLSDLSDEGEEFNLKYHIISKLPKHQAEECFKVWKHPCTAAFFAKKQTANILQLGKEIDKKTLASVKASRSYNDVNPEDQESTSFVPLTSLLQHFEDTVSVMAWHVSTIWRFVN
ncbi:hypothetical protein LOTGIDRAFT_160255 [Lottia gigantea]|uniref:Gamma-secretase-activating protein C-terminal domain-containing protein n=1 Tax=Lottia gigantea TaxID=225164 RepID=V4AFN5_LOTGI|nr:hypothetical protein LOTGIDRAFT_160255 [Lottia gigantea]ESO95702.1 hypothetical protein LOTGIDRAFT_160255 [Lottia gigantea]